MQKPETINSHQHSQNSHNRCDKFEKKTANISLLLSLSKYHPHSSKPWVFADNSLRDTAECSFRSAATEI